MQAKAVLRELLFYGSTAIVIAQQLMLCLSYRNVKSTRLYLT